MTGLPISTVFHATERFDIYRQYTTLGRFKAWPEQYTTLIAAAALDLDQPDRFYGYTLDDVNDRRAAVGWDELTESGGIVLVSGTDPAWSPGSAPLSTENPIAFYEPAQQASVLTFAVVLLQMRCYDAALMAKDVAHFGQRLAHNPRNQYS